MGDDAGGRANGTARRATLTDGLLTTAWLIECMVNAL